MSEFKITHIYHCGFLIETNFSYFLFDYYKGDIPKLKEDKPLYVFVSHFHKDHFNPKIFEYKNAHFLLSSEITSYPENLNVTSVSPNCSYTLSENVNIKTFLSTDCGVAYLVETENKRIYHAGDLNLWLWDTDTDEEKADMKHRFSSEIEKIKEFDIDLAFLSLDPRQKEYTALGLLEFSETVKPKKIFPMHFWGKYNYTANEIIEGTLKELKDILYIPDKSNNEYYL